MKHIEIVQNITNNAKTLSHQEIDILRAIHHVISKTSLDDTYPRVYKHLNMSNSVQIILDSLVSKNILIKLKTRPRSLFHEYIPNYTVFAEWGLHDDAKSAQKHRK